MTQISLLIVMMFGALLYAESETVALSGTVSNAGGNAVEGVSISLAGKAALTAVTDADGAFAISTTAILRGIHYEGDLTFSVRKNAVIFSSAARGGTGSVAVYSGNGRRLAFTRLSNIVTETQVDLPELGSGLYLLQVEVHGEVVTRSMMSMDGELCLETVAGSRSASFSSATTGSAVSVDTIIAEKEGYESAKVPVATYIDDNIAITLEAEGAAEGPCTRESMKLIVDKYIDAQKAGDPTRMPLSADAVVRENTEVVSVDESFLTKELKIDLHRSIYDVDSCRTFTEIIVATSKPTTVMGTRLRIVGNEITEVDAIITEEGEWLYDAGKYLEFSAKEEDEWYILPEDERPTREFLIDAGNQYFDIFNGDFEGLPWGGPCYRIEGGAITYKGDPDADYCKVDASGLTNTTTVITGRDYIVDVALGTVNVYCKFCTLDSHVFRLIDGHYRFVHTLTVGCN